MKKKFRVLSVFVSLLMVATLFAFPATGVKAGNNGPSEELDYASRIWINNGDEDNTIIWASDALKNQYNLEFPKVEGLSYDKKSNTLTVTKYTGDYLCTNAMGDDFTIKLVGESRIGAVIIYGWYYGGSVTFTGKGTLNISNYLDLEGEYTNSSVTVKKGATVTVEGSSDKTNIVFYDTNASKALTLEKGVQVNRNAIKCVVPNSTYDDNSNTLFLYERGDATYGVIINSTDNGLTYTAISEEGTVETYNSSKSFFSAGFMPQDSGYNFFYIPGKNVTISSSLNLKAAPKASVKVSGTTAKFTVKKYSGADGYEVRLYSSLFFSTGLYTTKTISKNGSAKRTLSIKKLPAGPYAAIVVPYTTVDGEKVYGTESAPVYFNVTK